MEDGTEPDIMINTGGLFRCCVAAAIAESDSRAKNGVVFKDGDLITTTCCKEIVVLRDGVWKWEGTSDIQCSILPTLEE